ncbi:hypothetical protein Cob_v006199 [Colletotrichum orbiculare MAFF 240422]|uniref:Clr5 domain-containing protein n=1 Tax=Colletotrichum orbiculare (strain 104-T / ATCC 96160 / CBS 514.97 / LARS 414 / MAFF 240422) TaxID=1213857 RepID=A0A484FSE9_COLOR|nr:hypothetical protein Cob_v006199 [Colletotrichum orbiculare MAFF 240422]
MPPGRPRFDLDPFKDDIVEAYNRRDTIESTLKSLHAKGVPVNTKTLQRPMHRWRLHQPRHGRHNPRRKLNPRHSNRSSNSNGIINNSTTWRQRSRTRCTTSRPLLHPALALEILKIKIRPSIFACTIPEDRAAIRHNHNPDHYHYHNHNHNHYDINHHCCSHISSSLIPFGHRHLNRIPIRSSSGNHRSHRR